MNDFIAIIKSVILKNYCNFEGRATRREFWMFFLFTFILGFIFGLFGKVGMYISCVVSLALLLPNLGLAVRRLHDINKSGWFLLLGLIPLVGGIILLVWYCKAGDNGANQYGEEPVTPTAENVQ